MERPQYANAFSVVYNHNLREVVLCFDHEYPDIVNNGKPGMNPAETKSARDNVCSVVLPEEIARPLIGALQQTLDQGKNDE